MNLHQKIHRMIRVNQAGEHGAVRIYQGQLAVLKDSSIASDITHMAEQEQEHKKIFDQLMTRYQVRPTVLSPLWHGAGYALGFITAALGKKGAMMCTVAVEEVIDEHYQRQLDILKQEGGPQELIDVIEKCQAEELEHKDLALEKEARSFIAYQPLSTGIKMASKVAIWFSTRL